MTAKELIKKAYENKEIEADIFGQLALGNFSDEAIEMAVERNWITRELADKFLGKNEEDANMEKIVITYVSRKTGKAYAFGGTINEGTTFVLVDEDGEKHLYAQSTIKKNFKKVNEILEVEKESNELSREVTVRAFTGMMIGSFKVEEEDSETVSVKGKNGKVMVFNKATGKQLNAKNPKFANKIDI